MLGGNACTKFVVSLSKVVYVFAKYRLLHVTKDAYLKVSQ